MGKHSWFLVVCLLMLVSCNDHENPGVLEKRVETAEKSLAEVVEQLAKSKEDIDGLKFFLASLEIIKDAEKMAVLTPGDSGYSLFKADIGTLSVKIIDIKPYADGSKVAIQIGNLSAATINGLKADVDWGPASEDGGPDNKKAKTKLIQFAQSIKSGSWSTQIMTLPSVAPENLGFIRLRNATHTGIGLNGS